MALIYRSHCKLMSLAELLGGVLLLSGRSDAVSLFWMSHRYVHVVTQWSIRVWTSVLCQSCSVYLGSVSPLKPKSLQWLCVEIPADSLRCWNLLYALKLVVIRNESCFHCHRLDHPKPPSKIPPSESIQSIARAKYFICCGFLLLHSFPVGTMWSPRCVLPAWASSFPSHHALNLNCLPIS